MGWQRSEGEGPGRLTGPGPRDARLAGFAHGGEWDSCRPGPELAEVLAAAGGPEWRCPGAEPDELFGILRRVAALESWASAAKLGVIRELIRRDDLPLVGRPRHGDLPDQWSDGLNHELALALAASVPSIEKTAQTAWELGARLPGVAALHADGTLGYAKVRLIVETFQWLSDEDAAKAEATILPDLTGTTGKTFGQIMNLAARIANEVDPGLAERRRKAAVKHASRVQMYREQSGAAALAGRDLPTDETLAAYANVTARATEYKDAGAFPDARMDQLRSTAYLDLINGVTADTRIALGHLSTDVSDPGAVGDNPAARDNPEAAQDNSDWKRDKGADARNPSHEAGPDDAESGNDSGGESGGHEPPIGPGPGSEGQAGGDPRGGGFGSGNQAHGRTDFPEDGDGSSDGGGSCGSSGGGSSGGSVGDGSAADRGGSVPPPIGGRSAGRPTLLDMVLPLATLLGLADRPGEGHGLGVFDPDLCRDLAELAALSPYSRVCVTVTDANGIAIGHGCARNAKLTGVSPGHPSAGAPPPDAAFRPGALPSVAVPASVAIPGGARPPAVAFPARMNLTITADQLSAIRSGALRLLGGSGRRVPSGWALTWRGANGSLGHGVRPRPAPSLGSAKAGDSRSDPDWCGTWVLAMPGGSELVVRIEPVPTYGCDHRHESHAYQPNDALRHLVQVRDYVCTFPSCSRHARESDFEHAKPYDKGGRTCSCNAGARSRKCHRVKQSPGWNVVQPKPGWHEWTTPSGRVYIQGPYRYPV
jgi:Domain of unknown function (DUF222)